MIIVMLKGGLGNQLFQYATALALAHRNNTLLRIDLDWFAHPAPGTTPRKYMLGSFPISGKVASAEEVRGIRPNPGRKKSVFPLNKLFSRPSPSDSFRYYAEKYFYFDPEVLHLGDNVYLDGYWQSEKYFCDAPGRIRSELVPRTATSPENVRITEMIMGCTAVSVHVRRGDYVSAPAVSAFHGTCSLDYYYRAVEKIASITPFPHFFIFSDDANWVKESLKLVHPMTVVEHNGPAEVHEDLRLMSLCRHHIIANSTLSWWGAWLCRNRDKVVIAPHRWFNDCSVNTDDLVPAAWLRI